eukprot:5070678-Alexandrium_andersonii.AAC.1
MRALAADLAQTGAVLEHARVRAHACPLRHLQDPRTPGFIPATAFRWMVHGDHAEALLGLACCAVDQCAIDRGS